MPEIVRAPDNYRSSSIMETIVLPSDKAAESKQAAQAIMNAQREKNKNLIEIDDSKEKKRKGRRKEQDQHEKE
ncbi:hypothetical protein OL233_05240 [Vagococcus sp. PNs007]|uniref:Uncharacterized protein n=1 Tax=Vagococcus proximus TaxID=2991417 RepID=A0ABT5X106_9ENTE|nr:hypothetical protein [Vagococcus proximus]MDF0479688.1 hypothetical protein [Vagococcus proximus]